MEVHGHRGLLCFEANDFVTGTGTTSTLASHDTALATGHYINELQGYKQAFFILSLHHG